MKENQSEPFDIDNNVISESMPVKFDNILKYSTSASIATKEISKSI